jgi:hypothetical protein
MRPVDSENVTKLLLCGPSSYFSWQHHFHFTWTDTRSCFAVTDICTVLLRCHRYLYCPVSLSQIFVLSCFAVTDMCTVLLRCHRYLYCPTSLSQIFVLPPIPSRNFSLTAIVCMLHCSAVLQMSHVPRVSSMRQLPLWHPSHMENIWISPTCEALLILFPSSKLIHLQYSTPCVLVVEVLLLVLPRYKGMFLAAIFLFTACNHTAPELLQLIYNIVNQTVPLQVNSFHVLSLINVSAIFFNVSSEQDETNYSLRLSFDEVWWCDSWKVSASTAICAFLLFRYRLRFGSLQAWL